MAYFEKQRDKYCYYMNFVVDSVGEITMQKHKIENDLLYFLPINGDDSYSFVLGSLAKMFGVEKYYSVCDYDTPFEDEMYCFLTDKVEIKFDSSTGLIEVKIKNDLNNEKKYNEIIVEMLIDYYSDLSRKMVR